METIIFALVSLMIFGFIKVWMDRKPLDADNKMIISAKEQAMFLGIIALVLIASIFVRSNHFTKNIPIALASMLLIGVTVFWMRQYRNRKK